MYVALAELALGPLPHHATASCSVFDAHPESSEVRQLVKVLGVRIDRSPDNKTAPCSLGRTARALRISLLTLASGSSMTIYKALSSGSVDMPLLSGETTAGSSPAAQRMVPDRVAHRQGCKTIFVVHFLAAARSRPSSAAGRIAACAGNVKKLFCQVYLRSLRCAVPGQFEPLYTHVEARFDRCWFTEFREHLTG
jgi:hypothetical protein